MNNISLTIRLPHELDLELSTAAKNLGMTKTNLLRGAIHDFLTSDKEELDFSSPYSNGHKSRMVLNVNQLTYDILAKVSKKNNESINAVITAVSLLALERATKWLQ